MMNLRSHAATMPVLCAVLVVACGDSAIAPDGGSPPDAAANDGGTPQEASVDVSENTRDAAIVVSVDARESLEDAGQDAGGDMDAGPDAGAVFESACLARSGPRVLIEGEQRMRYRTSSLADGSVIDARTAHWSGLDGDGAAIPWTVTFRYEGLGEDSCWAYGIIRGPWDENAPGITWEEPYHHSGGMTIDVPGLLVEGVQIYDQGDGIRPYAPDVVLRGVYLNDIHDDCIENDDNHALTVEGSFLDGCYVAFSARPFTVDAPDGSANVWSIRDSLVRLEPQPTVYRGPVPGHGGFFKWDSDGNRSPRVALHDTVFMAEQLPNHGTLEMPDSLEFESCSNNTLVWLGSGPAPAMGECFTVTRDRAVWDDAVARWHRIHPR